MKISQADLIMVPGYTNSDDDHWQSRWQRQMKTARRVEQEDWLKPVVEDWTDNLIAAIDRIRRERQFRFKQLVHSEKSDENRCTEGDIRG